MGGPPPAAGQAGGKGAGKAGGKGGPPPAAGGGKGKSKEDMEAAKKAKREAEKAAIEQKKAAELAHIKFLDDIPTRTAADISNKDWSSARVQVLLAGGTSIVEMGDGKLVCLRRSPSAVSEFIADRVAAALGVRTPKFRLVQPDDEEYKAIEDMTCRTDAYLFDMPMTFESFVKELKEAQGGFIPGETKVPLINKLEFTEPKRSSALLDCSEKAVGTVAVMEFLPGKGFDQCCGTLADDELRALGMIGALNGLLNKHTCVALPIWVDCEFESELTNVMKLDGQESAIAAIDSDVNVIKSSIISGTVERTNAAAELAGYVKRLQSLTSQLVKPDVPQAPIEGYSISAMSVVEQNVELLTKGGFQVTEASIAPLVQGLNTGFQKIASIWASGELQSVLLQAEAAASDIVPWPQSDQSILNAQLVCEPEPTASSPGHCAELVRSTAAAIADGCMRVP